MGLVAGAVVYVVYLSARCLFRVDHGHTAVLTSFRAAVREKSELKTFGPGVHFKWPWQKVLCVAMMEQNLVLSGDEGGATAMTEDGTVLRFDSILRYVPLEKELEHFLFDLKLPRDHITGLFTCLLRNEIADFHPDDKEEHPGGSYATIRRHRMLLNARIEAFCRDVISQRYGVQFSAVDLTDILPPDELAEALNAVLTAQTEADADHSHAEAECQKRVMAAERGVEVAKTRALAVEREIWTLAGVLADLKKQGTLAAYIERRRFEVLSQSRTLFMRSK